ncbi:MAG: hypothetical protein JXD19_08290 [Deltaproteobacteria bacterium]|nr:hypothetical protein [Deltaproteobacteria bacterium]
MKAATKYGRRETLDVMRESKKQKYKDPIVCPVCGKVFGEWVEVNGAVTTKKWCEV